MRNIKLCKECGVPLMVSRSQTWHDNGTITQTKDPDHRMVFYESNDFNGLVAGIERMIGLSIDDIVIETKRREVKEYVEKLYSPLARRIARRVGVARAIDSLSTEGRALGFGDIGLVGWKRKGGDDDYITVSVKKPHWLLSFCGEVLGAWEAIDSRDSCVTHEQVGDDEHRVTCRIGSHPIGLQERLQFRSNKPKPGDIVLERCPSCSVPLGVAAYRWNIEGGTIAQPETGRRMAVVGSWGVEAIMEDLEAELGETIPETAIEAQRLHVKQAMKDDDWKGAPTDYRQALAFRGLGNLTHFGGRREHLEIIIENACMPYLTVGFVQAFYELALGYERSTYEYELSPDGVLNIDIFAAE
jgi:hypothetical protein